MLLSVPVCHCVLGVVLLPTSDVDTCPRRENSAWLTSDSSGVSMELELGHKTGGGVGDMIRGQGIAHWEACLASPV